MAIIDDGADNLIWASVETACAIIAASIPVLRPLLTGKISANTNPSKESANRPRSVGGMGMGNSIQLSERNKGLFDTMTSRYDYVEQGKDDSSGRSILNEYDPSNPEAPKVALPWGSNRFSTYITAKRG
jgi:hypothetical protein